MATKVKQKSETEKPFNYPEWLKGLTVGDRVKIADCSHRSCNCSTLIVNGVVKMFGLPAIMVQSGCTAKFFCGLSGRELGARKNTFKPGNLAPWTEEDKAKEALEKKKKEELNARYEAARLLSEALCGKQDTLYYNLKEYMTLEQIITALQKLGVTS